MSVITHSYRGWVSFTPEFITDARRIMGNTNLLDEFMMPPVASDSIAFEGGRGGSFSLIDGVNRTTHTRLTGMDSTLAQVLLMRAKHYSPRFKFSATEDSTAARARYRALFGTEAPAFDPFDTRQTPTTRHRSNSNRGRSSRFAAYAEHAGYGA